MRIVTAERVHAYIIYTALLCSSYVIALVPMACTATCNYLMATMMILMQLPYFFRNVHIERTFLLFFEVHYGGQWPNAQ